MKKDKTIEQKLEQIKNILDELEKGELPIDEMMERYKKAQTLSGQITKQIEEAKNVFVVEDEQG